MHGPQLARESGDTASPLQAGVGHKLETDLAEHGLHLVGDLAAAGRPRLVQLFGDRVGRFLHAASLGQVSALRPPCLLAAALGKSALWQPARSLPTGPPLPWQRAADLECSRGQTLTGR